MGNLVREVRTDRGMSQQRLAELSGVTRLTIISVETRPGYNISKMTMDKIAAALDCSVAALFFPEESGSK